MIRYSYSRECFYSNEDDKFVVYHNRRRQREFDPVFFESQKKFFEWYNGEQMGEITKCTPTVCDIKKSCYRHEKPDSDWQSYADFSEESIENGICEYFVMITNEQDITNLE